MDPVGMAEEGAVSVGVSGQMLSHRDGEQERAGDSRPVCEGSYLQDGCPHF